MKRGIILFFSFLFPCLLNAQLSTQQDTIRYVMANLNLRESPNTTSAIITQGSYIPPDPKPGGYNLCL